MRRFGSGPWAVFVAALVALLVAGLVAGCPRGASPEVVDPPPTVVVSLTGVSPRTVSNDTSQPLLVWGRGLRAGLRVSVGAPFQRDLPLAVVDDTFGSIRLPADLAVPAQTAEVATTLTLIDERGAAVGSPIEIVVVNDRSFPDVWGLVATADLAFAATVSFTTDALIVVETATGTVSVVPTGDGPWAIALERIDGQETFVVAHRYSPELQLIAARPAADGTRAVRRLPAPTQAHALLVHDGVAYVGEHANDTLSAIDLRDGAVRWRAPCVPNPRGITLVTRGRGPSPTHVMVGSLVSGEVQSFAIVDGAASEARAPRPGIEILGGHTEAFADAVMGGKGVRALVSDGATVFAATIGPAIGPNAASMETSGTGGVGVIDGLTQTSMRHLGFGRGIPQALALDRKRGRLFVADIGLGVVHTVDGRALAHRDRRVRRAARQGAVPLPLPTTWPLVRAAADFGVDGGIEVGPQAGGPRPDRTRAGVEVHTGPSALALSQDGTTLLVLERFTGRLTTLDVSGPTPRVTGSVVLFDALTQQERRLGQVLFFADVGRTGMSCDACHLEGHTEGVFFTKTGQARMWRSPTLRGVRDVPPYFNPPAHATLEHTASYVGSRNRFQNPPLDATEVRLLTAYTRSLVTPPNPWRADDGGLLPSVEFDDGQRGDPRRGRAHFLARCGSCHPAPLFSTDQDAATRRRFMKMQTPAVLPLRLEWQDVRFAVRTPPSLIGAFDIWPMLVSAAAGFSVDGDALVASDHDALEAMFSRYLGAGHGQIEQLSQRDRADLRAFVQSL
jgi:DNA-binding beta-propeller fold protein YncE